MIYVWDYCVASALFLSIIIFFYTRQRRLPSLRTKIYSLMLLVVLLSLIFDFISAAMNPLGATHPEWLSYVINIILLALTQLIPLLFLLYVLILTGIFPKIRKWARVLLLLPYATTFILLLLSPIGTFGIFYMSDFFYYQGASHLTLYGEAAIYLITSIVCLAVSSGQIQKKKTIMLYVFIGLSVCAMVLQLLFKQYILNTTASALALVMIYLSLEAPSQNIDAVTDVFNRSALRSILEDMLEQNQQFYLVLFPMKTITMTDVSMGTKKADELRIAIASYFSKEFSECHILRLKGDTFALLCPDEQLDGYVLSNIHARVPELWKISDMDIRVPICAIGINSIDLQGIEQITILLDYIIANSDSFIERSCVWVNDEIIEQALRQKTIELAVKRAIDNNTINVYYQPIVDEKGKTIGLEALARLFDEKLGAISPAFFIPIAESNGLIYQLGFQVFSKVCQFISRNRPDEKGINYISVNISMLQLMRESLASDLNNEIRRYNTGGCKILLEITESSAFSDIPVAQSNIERLSNNGFKFFLDDFGTGYANFTKLNKLPLTTVKIDSTLLWSAMKDERDKSLLFGIIQILQQQKLSIVCEGVETEEQAELLLSRGITMRQGYLYSRPLPEKDIIKYLG